VILSRAFAGIIFMCFVAALSPAGAADARPEAPPFIFSPSALAPAAARGWVVLLPGEDELAFAAISSHYEKVALLLNANGFDTLIVPYEDAFDEDVDGDPDSEGDRIAAVTMRAVQWMHDKHSDTEGEPGAIIAWAAGAQGLSVIAATGTKYPIANLVASVAFYPDVIEETAFNSRLPMLVQTGAEDEGAAALRHYLGVQEPGSVEPEFVPYDGAKQGFDVESFAKSKTVRSVPIIGASVTLAYNAAAAHAAQQKMLAFLKSRLEAPE
jgi:dienelactone hydrolase